MNTEDKQPKENFIYFNDEWNTPKEEEKKIIKNDKPDGRRYKK